MRLLEIKKIDIANGPGVRVSIWPSGCSTHCPGCHNKEAQNSENGELFNEEHLKTILDALKPDYIQGLSLLGGDPLYKNNIEECTKICKKVKETYPNKDIWLWTGYLFEDVCDLEIFNYVDYCVDGPFILAQRDITLQYRGSPNQRVINVKDKKK